MGEGFTARKGTTHKTYQGNTLGLRTAKPPVSGTAPSTNVDGLRHHTTQALQAAMASMDTIGESITERARPGLKYSCSI